MRGRRTNWEDWVRRAERRFSEQRELEEVTGGKRWEVNWRSERREGKGEEYEGMRQVKGGIGTGKGEKKGKGLGEESRGTSGRSSGCEGKGKGGFEEQRWWDDWWDMKEWSREKLEGGDLRDKKREKAKSMRLRSASMGVAERLGEQTASELRLAEC